MRTVHSLVIALSICVAREAFAQSADQSCAYTECAFGLSPRLTGLDVVRGASGARVATLNFFFPSDISPRYAGNDSAVHYARRALSTRRAASTLTDIGLGLFAIAGAKIAADRDVNRGSAAWLGAGAALFSVSLPLQLRADGELSRAVWWYNSRFNR